MLKKRGRNIIIRRENIKASFYDTDLFDNKIYDEEIERIIIKSDFGFDDDVAPHFAEYPNLKEIKIGIKNSCYEVHDGLLYLRLNEETFNKKNFGYNLGYFDYKKEVNVRIKEGLLLICCPRSINRTDIILHEDCTAIYGSAFDGCNLNSITISHAFRYGCPAAFANLTVKRMYVPFKNDVWIESSHTINNKDVIVECNKGDIDIRKNICQWWESVLTGIYE
ncbi:MAG: hypothetical protein IJ524_07655 [Bacteroidales bacterium]|nr:hypothetical protein [Bacteroidales bacterium]